MTSDLDLRISNFNFAKAIQRNKTSHPFEIGDTLVSEWGATMRIVSFYEVVKLKGKTMIELREVKAVETPDGGFLTGYAKPATGENRFCYLQPHERMPDGSPLKPIVRKVCEALPSGAAVVYIEKFERAEKYNPQRYYGFNHCD